MHPLRLLIVAVFVFSNSAGAQSAPSSALIGTWTLERVDNINPDGSRVHLYGESPQGVLTFDAAGHYALQIMRADRPRFAANDRLKGSDAEVRALAEGINTHWGRYSIDSSGTMLVFAIDHASFPNWEGQLRPTRFLLATNRLTYSVASPTTGGPGVTGEVVWRRLP
jgi:hypothetical protein